MRWKVLCFVLLCVVLIQCGDDAMPPDTNADPLPQNISMEVYEFKTPDELTAFKFPTDTKGTLGFRLTRIGDEVIPVRSTPVFTETGRHGIEDDFVDTEAIRIIVFR